MQTGNKTKWALFVVAGAMSCDAAMAQPPTQRHELIATKAARLLAQEVADMHCECGLGSDGVRRQLVGQEEALLPPQPLRQRLHLRREGRLLYACPATNHPSAVSPSDAIPRQPV